MSRQPCVGEDEALVAVGDIPSIDAYSQLGILPRRKPMLRRSVVHRINCARALLRPPFDLVILDAYRTLDEQRVLLDHYSLGGPTGRFVASVEPDAIRPPHTTGGAVDLTLSWNGKPLGLGTDFDAFIDAAQLHAFEHVEGTIRQLRRILAGCLLQSGFATYEIEWWHWSFGDDVWAYANGVPALFEVL